MALGAAGTALFASLVLLGLAVLRTRALPPPWHALPLGIGIAAVPSMFTGGLLGLVIDDEALAEHLMEIPIVALGAAFVALGAALWAAAGRREP